MVEFLVITGTPIYLYTTAIFLTKGFHLLTIWDYPLQGFSGYVNGASMIFSNKLRQYARLFVFYFLLAILLPLPHSHGAHVERDYGRNSVCSIYHGGASGADDARCCAWHEEDDHLLSLHHIRFLLDDDNAASISPRSGELVSAPSLSDFLPSIAPSPALVSTFIPATHAPPVKPLKPHLSKFSGLSPPRS